ncbi:MAG: DUF2846 domain-containing protein [Desulfobacterales bacterium]|nr:DUF2846 domain-containing protein [Desulfobacterales bacterium]
MKNESSCTNNYLIALIILALCTIAGCSATGKAFIPIEPTQDKSLIYIYRPDRFLGSGNVWYLSDNEKQLTMVNNGGWFAYHKNPGDVTFYSNLRPGVGTILPGMLDSDKKMITFNVVAGRTYYVKFDHRFSGPYMELVDNNLGEKEIKGLKLFDRIKED